MFPKNLMTNQLNQYNGRYIISIANVVVETET